MSLDFTIKQNNDVLITITVTDEAGAAVDITGSSINWTLRRTGAAVAAVTKTTADGIAITDGASGEFQITLDNEDTENLKGSFTHEATITTVENKVLTVTNSDVSAGAVTVVPQFTPPL